MRRLYLPWSTDTLQQTSLSTEIRRRLDSHWKTMSDFSFDCARCNENRTFQIVCRNDGRICPGISPLNTTTSYMLNAGHWQVIFLALGINCQKDITNEDAYTKSGLLPFSQTIRKRIFRLICNSLRLQNRSIFFLGSMLQHFNVVFSVRRGQGQTWN